MPLKPEIFLLRDEKGPILYAPLRQLSARMNEAAVGAVARRLRGGAPAEGDADLLADLDTHGFFEPCDPPVFDPKPPTHLTLFPTDGCNLRCRYCYAGAEKPRHVMPPEVGKAAVDTVIRNALDRGVQEIEVSFHGNGEPFTAFPTVKLLSEYALDRAEENGLTCWITATSNGVMSDEALDWVIAFVTDITISFDVLEALQNRQRPMAGGLPSWEAADRTLRRLDAAGKSYSIRTTLTRDSVTQLVPLAQAAAERYPHCALLHIEPCWESGRSLTTGEHIPDPEVFAREFLRAEELLADKVSLVYSACRDSNDMTFCSAPSGGFTVTSEGLVSACYEVCEDSNPCAGRFVYGRWDGTRFVYDEEKLAALRTLTVDRMPYCKDCFCKYSCSGDCPAKLLGTADPSEHHGSDRCTVTRTLTLAHIARNLDMKTEETEHAE